jgi:hypothetical protein
LNLERTDLIVPENLVGDLNETPLVILSIPLPKHGETISIDAWTTQVSSVGVSSVLMSVYPRQFLRTGWGATFRSLCILLVNL